MHAIGTPPPERLKNEHTEADILRQFDPLMLSPSTTVALAARQMRNRNVSAALVVEGDAKLVGIFTERDALCRVLAEAKEPVTTTLAEVMTNNPDTITPQHTAKQVVRLMQDLRCRHLPIVQDGKAVGIVSLLVPGEGDRGNRSD